VPLDLLAPLELAVFQDLLGRKVTKVTKATRAMLVALETLARKATKVMAALPVPLAPPVPLVLMARLVQQVPMGNPALRGLLAVVC
jgi:hypothetical protein